MDSIELSSILDCFGDQITIKSTNTYTIWLEAIAKVLNMLIELKGNNYYSKVFKRFNYKLQNNTFWVVIKGLSHNKNGGQNTLKLKLPSRTGSQLADKKSETLTENSSQNKESNKTNCAQFLAWMRENQPKQCKAFIKRSCHQATCWTGSQPVHQIEKKSEIYQKIPWRIRNLKKTALNSEPRWERTGQNNAKRFKTEVATEPPYHTKMKATLSS